MTTVENSVEMGVYPFIQEADTTEDEESVDTSYGPVKVNIYGERDKYPIVTFHDIGMNAANNFENFFQYQACTKLIDRFCIYNLNAPGQESDAKKLPANYRFPSMDGLAQIIDEVVLHFKLNTFIGVGIGAGANVFMRYALSHSNQLDGLVIINATSQKAGWIEWFYQKWNLNYLHSERMTQFTVDYLMWHHFGKHIDECNPDIVHQYRSFFYNHPNLRNLALYIEAFLNRTEVILRDPKSTTDFLLNIPVLQIIGLNSAFVNESVHVNSQLNPKISEWLKISDSCGLVLDDKPLDVTQALLLFLQGLGFCSDLNVSHLLDSMREKQDGRGKLNNAFHSMIERVDEN